MAITAIGGMLTTVGGASGAAGAGVPAGGAGQRFAQALSKVVEDADTADRDANIRIGAMVDGTGEVHDAMIALQKADISLQMTVQVRNKLMNAYQEIMRMPV
jgi:flagellar hook-basal body complex protein FliE